MCGNDCKRTSDSRNSSLDRWAVGQPHSATALFVTKNASDSLFEPFIQHASIDNDPLNLVPPQLHDACGHLESIPGTELDT
jgi:hypothetical protein